MKKSEIEKHELVGQLRGFVAIDGAPLYSTDDDVWFYCARPLCDEHSNFYVRYEADELFSSIWLASMLSDSCMCKPGKLYKCVITVFEDDGEPYEEGYCTIARKEEEL